MCRHSLGYGPLSIHIHRWRSVVFTVATVSPAGSSACLTCKTLLSTKSTYTIVGKLKRVYSQYFKVLLQHLWFMVLPHWSVILEEPSTLFMLDRNQKKKKILNRYWEGMSLKFVYAPRKNQTWHSYFLFTSVSSFIEEDSIVTWYLNKLCSSFWSLMYSIVHNSFSCRTLIYFVFQ